jgi:hypothetical protein
MSITKKKAGVSTPAVACHPRLAVDLLGPDIRSFISDTMIAAATAKSYAITTIKEPQILLGHKRYILLLSHPRCYTSLIAHIFGSHPEIVGSCETYNRLRNRRDLIRLRYMTYWLNDRKIKGKYIFDKILNCDIQISSVILNRDDVTVVFTVRGPERTIPSMIRLGFDPRFKGKQYDGQGWEQHQDPAYACDFYIRRLESLEQHCLGLKEKPLYFDADDLIERTTDLLQALRRELQLSQDLSERYETFEHTGNVCGDTSEQIKSGGIDRTKSDYTDIVVPDDLMERARAAYEHCRSLLRERSVCL